MSAAAPTVGETLATTHGTWNGSPTSYTYQWQFSTNSGSTWSSIPGATSSSYVVTSTYLADIIRVQVTATNAASESGVAYAAATGVVTASGAVAQSYFWSGDPINTPIVSSPVIDSNNSTWQSLFTPGMFAAMDTSPLYGFPIYIAKATDPIVTCHGSYQSATFHLPQGCVPEGASDGHMIIVEPVGVSSIFPDFAVETEFFACTVSGTWPNQTVTVGQGSAPCQFLCQTTLPPSTSPAITDISRNVAGLTQAQVLAGVNGTAGALRGANFSILAGNVLQSEFEAGQIPHAITATVSWSADTPQLPGTQGPFRTPAITGAQTGAGISGGIPFGARIQLDPAHSISGYTASQQIVAKCLQTYGFYVTDTTGGTGNAVVFQAQTTDGTNAAYAALDEQNGNTLGTLDMWQHMRVLAAWNT